MRSHDHDWAGLCLSCDRQNGLVVKPLEVVSEAVASESAHLITLKMASHVDWPVCSINGEAIMERMNAAHAADDFEAEAASEIEFHNAIVECAHNIVLLHTLRACYRLLSDGVFLNRTRIYAMPDARNTLLGQHRAIYDAIVAGDPAVARAAAVAHIDFVEKATFEAERSGDWQRISRLRLNQRGGTETVQP